MSPLPLLLALIPLVVLLLGGLYLHERQLRAEMGRLQARMEGDLEATSEAVERGRERVDEV